MPLLYILKFDSRQIQGKCKVCGTDNVELQKKGNNRWQHSKCLVNVHKFDRKGMNLRKTSHYPSHYICTSD